MNFLPFLFSRFPKSHRFKDGDRLTAGLLSRQHASHHRSRRAMLPTLRLFSRQALRLTMYTGTDCSLCDLMKQQIEIASQSMPQIQLCTYNIRDDSLAQVHVWRRKYQYDIPVLHLGDRGECAIPPPFFSNVDCRLINRFRVSSCERLEIFRHRVSAEDLVKRLREELDERKDKE